MKIGINRWTMPAEWSALKCLRAASDAKFDSLEFNLAEDGVLGLAAREADVRKIAAQAGRIGVELSGLSSGLYWSFPLTHPDANMRKKAQAIVRTQLQIARWLGVGAILVVPGIVNAETPYDKAYERSLNSLRPLVAEAKRLGVKIGLENVWNKFLLSPLEFRQFVDEFDSPYVGAYFDAGNVLVTGYPDQWIRILGKRIVRVHVKDFKPTIGNIRGFTNLLQGDVPFDRVRAALRAIGYNGHVTAEVEGYPRHPQLGLQHIAESLRTVFK